ncbi:unnamed protein product [Cyprideis torosa]|uniref:Uncharacterized protein n=1 Tax=Cyprideis torosa TaxID=163714 RepID=A0A7R8ZYF5_9CRUS|nr:unnamed protein product [Cyprideis torosa]CAG0908459.1 unnamed protein product [Cyprideis torosa]
MEDLLDRMESFEALDDLDMDLIDGVLTVTFEDNSKVIINRQEPVRQLWLASPEGPAHFAQDEAGAWLNIKTSDDFYDTLSRVFSDKTQANIQFN